MISMLLAYMKAALHYATYEILTDEGTFYGEIAQCQGVYANAETLEACREQLEEVLEEWILFRLHHNLLLPVIDGMDLNFKWGAFPKKGKNKFGTKSG
ncbi:Protein of unknown function UPF0150 [Beggiatoa sp. SS]|nr:Protein of unknown function UPF0150 [Beggiatoa sp. SS]